MSESILLIQKKIEHLKRMRVYLDYGQQRLILNAATIRSEEKVPGPFSLR